MENFDWAAEVGRLNAEIVRLQAQRDEFVSVVLSRDAEIERLEARNTSEFEHGFERGMAFRTERHDALAMEIERLRTRNAELAAALREIAGETGRYPAPEETRKMARAALAKVEGA